MIKQRRIKWSKALETLERTPQVDRIEAVILSLGRGGVKEEIEDRFELIRKQGVSVVDSDLVSELIEIEI